MLNFQLYLFYNAGGKDLSISIITIDLICDFLLKLDTLYILYKGCYKDAQN